MLVVIHSDEDQPDANLQEGDIEEFWRLQEEFGKYCNIAKKDSQNCNTLIASRNLMLYQIHYYSVLS